MPNIQVPGGPVQWVSAGQAAQMAMSGQVFSVLPGTQPMGVGAAVGLPGGPVATDVPFAGADTNGGVGEHFSPVIGMHHHEDEPGHSFADPHGFPPGGGEPGADLRDDPTVMQASPETLAMIGGGPAQAGLPAVVGGAALAARAIQVVRQMPGFSGNIVTAGVWGRLPSWVRAALGAVGIGVGGSLLGVPGFGDFPGLGGGDDGHMPTHMTDGHLGAHIVGSWVANGVTFYRLSDGKLAVQNKKGRWKVWRPKRPIVIMPTGATNLRTLLRADKVLNKQAKEIASMLNRRAGGRKRSTAATKPVVVVQESGPGSVRVLPS